VKTKLGFVGAAGLAAVALACYLGSGGLPGSRAWAQNKTAAPGAPGAPAPSAAAARTRVAIVNLHEVVKSYTKYKTLRDQLKKKDEEYVEQLKNKQKRIEGLMNEAKDAKTTQKRKDDIEVEINQIKFEMQQIQKEAQKNIVKVQEEQLAQIYREVYQVVSEYCAANGIDLVMRYNEEWNDEYYQPAKVVGRMNMPFYPMYWDKALEITGPIAQALNYKYSAAPGGKDVVPASGTAPGTK
jgi:Skp family chaperone for outer membrane proteins